MSTAVVMTPPAASKGITVLKHRAVLWYRFTQCDHYGLLYRIVFSSKNALANVLACINWASIAGYLLTGSGYVFQFISAIAGLYTTTKKFNRLPNISGVQQQGRTSVKTLRRQVNSSRRYVTGNSYDMYYITFSGSSNTTELQRELCSTG